MTNKHHGLPDFGQFTKEKVKTPMKEINVCGSQLNLNFDEYSLGDIQTKKQLREVLIKNITEWGSGNSESGLLIPPDSVNDNDGHSKELIIKKNGDLISKPIEGKILFMSYYFYDEEVYEVPLINNEPITVIGEEFNGQYYFSQFFQGDQNLDANPTDVGEQNGDVSWQFMTHNKTISMDDLREIDFDSEDMEELINNVYSLYQ